MADKPLLAHEPTADAGEATVTVDPDVRGDTIDPYLFGKFGEHLYSSWNAKNALEAQVLHNPTFGPWKFQVHESGPDGGRPGIHDEEEKADRVGDYVDRRDYPGADPLIDAYRDGTALWWFHYGPEGAVRTSPDVGTAGDRAQRLELDDPNEPAGLAQWTHLPLHRTRGFEGTVTLRARDGAELRIALHAADGEDGALGAPLAETTVEAGPEFDTADFALELPEDADDDPDALYAVSVTGTGTANVVLDRLLVYPDDHVNYADPELIEHFRDADLPLFRWPGGNFVSGYHWEDGIGPIEERPTKPNPAWDGLETNLFGTAEFVEFCREVGCEPMICLNAGNGTAEEAARWVEYCNGDPDETEMGALRAEHGYEEPFDVTLWEVGNEVYGPWQTSWTTPEGYADRYERLHEAMTGVDDSIEVLACGNRLTDWNDPVVETCPDRIDWLTDHVLIGNTVGPEMDGVDLYNSYMALAERVMDEYDEVAADMDAAGVADSRIAITELQLFPYPEDDREAPVPTNKSLSEVTYDATFVHASVRSDAVEMITHSGIGNHAASVQKRKERVFPDPRHHYQRMGPALFDGTPLGVTLECDSYDTETTYNTGSSDLFGEIRPTEDVPVIDPLAVETDDGLVVDLVHRDAGADDIDATVEVPGAADGEATVTTITAEEMDVSNSLADPDNVSPEESTATVADGRVSLTVPSMSVTRIELDR